MRCGECFEPYERQPMGNWLPGCGCKSKRYWSTLQPLVKDWWLYSELTGSRIRWREDEERVMWYRYGPAD